MYLINQNKTPTSDADLFEQASNENNITNMNRDLNYENANIAYDSQYPEDDGGGIKCKNYIVCGTVLPKWWFDCKGCYLCTNCDMMFGTWKSSDHQYTGKGILDITGILECPICLEAKESISQLNCDHSLCISCFKRCYYGDQSNEGEPIFPYPDIEDEYYTDTENAKWEKDYPLIKIYDEECNKWYDAREEKYEEESHLRRCPICRK